MALIGEAGARPVPQEESSYKNEVSMLRAALEAAASKQSDRRKADTLAMIAILEDKRVAVMANEQTGYFVPRVAGISRSSPRTDHWRFPLSGDQISARDRKNEIDAGRRSRRSLRRRDFLTLATMRFQCLRKS